jgi:hypothetical protein
LETIKSYLPAPLNQWSFDGQVQTDGELHGAWNDLEVTGVVESDAIQLRGKEVAAARVALSAPFVWKKPSLRFKKSRLRATKVVYEPKDLWSGAIAELRLESSLDHQAGQPLKIDGLFDIAGAQFHSPDNSKVGENISIKGPFSLSTQGADRVSALVGRFTIESGELLWGRFFADLKRQRPALELDADYLHGGNLLRCRRCALDLANIGRLEVTGAVEHLGATPQLRLRAVSGNFSPNGFFEFFLRENFRRQYPILDKLAGGGEISFDLQLEGPLDALSAAGNLSLKGGELRAKSAQSSDWRIGPITLDLPIQIQLGENSARAAAVPRPGTLAIDNMRFAGQTTESILVPISLAHNELRSLRPISLGVFGGVLTIDRLWWPDLLNDPTRFSFSADAKKLRLDELAQAMGWPRLGGTLTGSIPEVQSNANLLGTRGEIDVDLFGGRMRMGSLAIENPFSSLPSIKLDARFDEIQLEQLTQTFAFGRIAGVIAGNIDNLILIAGQPSEFSAQLYSVDRGEEQRISVEALDKITVLSSGESASALYSGIAGLFDSFRYSKLGFNAILKNDRLTLRGVENRGGQEMLVVGSFLPPTVNVVSHTQQIAFSELLRRLERINKTAHPNVK